MPALKSVTNALTLVLKVHYVQMQDGHLALLSLSDSYQALQSFLQ